MRCALNWIRKSFAGFCLMGQTWFIRSNVAHNKMIRIIFVVSYCFRFGAGDPRSKRIRKAIFQLFNIVVGGGGTFSSGVLASPKSCPRHHPNRCYPLSVSRTHDGLASQMKFYSVLFLRRFGSTMKLFAGAESRRLACANTLFPCVCDCIRCNIQRVNPRPFQLLITCSRWIERFPPQKIII